MVESLSDDKSKGSPADRPRDVSRRRFLGQMASLGAAALAGTMALPNNAEAKGGAWETKRYKIKEMEREIEFNKNEIQTLSLITADQIKEINITPFLGKTPQQITHDSARKGAAIDAVVGGVSGALIGTLIPKEPEDKKEGALTFGALGAVVGLVEGGIRGGSSTESRQDYRTAMEKESKFSKFIVNKRRNNEVVTQGDINKEIQNLSEINVKYQEEIEKIKEELIRAGVAL